MSELSIDAVVNKLDIIKKTIINLFIVVIILCIIYLSTFKREIYLSQYEITIKIPPILISGLFYNNKISIFSKNGNFVNLLYNSFDRPLLILPDINQKKIYILYHFDIKEYIFLIEDNDKSMSLHYSKINQDFSNIINASKGFHIRQLSDNEIIYIKNIIDKLTLDEYKKIAIPSLDLGLYKFYVPKKRLYSIFQNN